MTIFYTVDREVILGSMTPLYSGLQISCNELFDDLTSVSATNLANLLPGGYSRHGKQYLIDNHRMTRHSGHPMELILELIRQRDYPTKPSRLKSAFGCLSLTDAKTFRNLDLPFINAPIFEISPDLQPTHIADMNLLNISCPAHEYLNKCHLYWQGLAGPSPFWEAVIPLPAMIGKQVA